MYSTFASGPENQSVGRTNLILLQMFEDADKQPLPMQKDVELGTIAGYKRTTEYKSFFSRIPVQHHASLLILLPAFCCCLLIFGIIVCIFYARKKTAKVEGYSDQQLTQQSNVIS